MAPKFPIWLPFPGSSPQPALGMCLMAGSLYDFDPWIWGRFERPWVSPKSSGTGLGMGGLFLGENHLSPI